MERRVIITGATGLLGRSLLQTYENASWNVQGWGFTRADGTRVKRVDVTIPAEVSRNLELFRPHLVIHAAAERHPDVIEKNPEGVHSLNVDATRFLADECARLHVKFIYISTDYVFDGVHPPYSESASTNPLNAYGESKLMGEVVSLASSAKHAVFRVPILFGTVEKLEESAVTILFNALRDASKPCQMDDAQLRYPTHVDHVAHALLRFSALCRAYDLENPDGSSNGHCGIFHFSARERFTKYGMATTMARAFGFDASHLEPVDSSGLSSTAAKRPHDARLSCDKLEKLGISCTSDFSEEIRTVLKPFL